MGHGIFGQLINRLGKTADFSHKKGKGRGFGKRSAYPHLIFMGAPLREGGAEGGGAVIWSFHDLPGQKPPC